MPPERWLPKVLLVHDYYIQRGGEDFVFEEEGALLEARGCKVIRYTRRNSQIPEMGRRALFRAAFRGQPAADELRDIVRRERPDVAHFHNTFPLISPVACRAVKAEGVPVVVTLHNFRRVCLNGLLYRDGHVCEDCACRALPWPGILHACYHQGRLASAVAAFAHFSHRRSRVWERSVDLFLTPSEFCLKKLGECGMDVSRAAVKHNHVHSDIEPGPWPRQPFAFFAGRLSPEKGVPTLLKAWERIGADLPLKIAGVGPVGEEAERNGSPPGVEWLGWKALSDIHALMRACSFLVVPSRWYETGGPRTVLEAFGAGTPVLASRLGCMADFVQDGRNGLLFSPEDPGDLAAKALWMKGHPDEAARMGRQAREDFLARYTAAHNFDSLMGVYERVTGRGPRAGGP